MKKLLEKGTPIKLTIAFRATYNSKIVAASGRTGKVLRYTTDGTKIGIEFNSPVKYSGNCHATGKDGHCLYIPVEMVEETSSVETPIEILNKSFTVNDTVYLIVNYTTVAGYTIRKGESVKIIEIDTTRMYAPFLVTNDEHVEVWATSLQITKQKPIQKLDIKSTKDKEWMGAAQWAAEKVITVYSPDKSTKPILAASLLVLV